MGVDVNDAGHQGEATGVHSALRSVGDFPDPGDAPVAHGDVGYTGSAAAAIDYAGTANDQVMHRFFASINPPPPAPPGS
jgi:hypothetical protein